MHTTNRIRPPILHLKEFYLCEPGKDWAIDVANALEHDATNEKHNEKKKYFFENAHFLPPFFEKRVDFSCRIAYNNIANKADVFLEHITPRPA